MISHYAVPIAIRSYDSLCRISYYMTQAMLMLLRRSYALHMLYHHHVLYIIAVHVTSASRRAVCMSQVQCSVHG